MSSNLKIQPNLHDWLALGDLEVALAPAESNTRIADEIRHLPMLLRILSASQPQASIPTIQEKRLVSEEMESDNVSDPLVDEVVSLLEDVAASYSAAEEVDALTSYHAPSTCRRISRLTPLKRDRRKRSWETRDLATVAASPLAGGHRKKCRSEVTKSTNESDPDIRVSDDDDGMSVDDVGGLTGPVETSRRRSSEIMSSETPADSHEAKVAKCLQELASLVVASLEPPMQNKDDDEAVPNYSLSLPITADSLLSEPRSGLESSAIGGCDLGAIASALMHHAPVLRHRHLAAALCRTAAPQAVVLIQRMGANSPTSIPCLLRGCIDTFARATEDALPHTAVANTAKASVRSLASLSSRESFNVRTTLQLAKVMVDVQLELAVEQDPIAVACLLNEHLSSRGAVCQGEHNSTQETVTQPVSDSLSERACKSTDVQTARSGTPSLRSILANNAALYERSFVCVLDALDLGGGRSALFLRALSLLVLFGSDWTSDSDNHPEDSALYKNGAQKLVSLRRNLFDGAADVVPANSEQDECFRLFACACLIMYALAASNFRDDGDCMQEAHNCLDCIFSSQMISLRSNVFISRLAGVLKSQDGERIYSLIIQTLRDRGSFVRDDVLEDIMKQIGKVASSRFNLDSEISKGTSDAAAIVDLSALLQSTELDASFGRLQEFVQSALNDPAKCNILIRSELVCDIIEASVAAATKSGGVVVPLVLSVALQSLSLQIDWREVGARFSMPTLESQFLLQLIYCLTFLEQEPSSPFVIDPREFPLRKAIYLCKMSDESDELAHIESRLQQFIGGVAQEVSDQVDLHLTIGVSSCTAETGTVQSIRRRLCYGVTECIRACKSDQSKDPSGRTAERTFAYASRQLPPSEIQLMAIRALLASPNEPPPFITYAGLCRDPLVAFKTPLAVWHCTGLRRIALYILACLLEQNDRVIATTSPTEGVASELLASRDAIVVRCLVAASVGVYGRAGLSTFNCSMTIAMIRSMVAKQPGLVAALCKQERNHIIDFFVDYVPESIQDAEALINQLSAERRSLTAAEKLLTAEVALRIAIAHGHRDESVAKTLVYAALTRLISSFFLLIGPVGVPVSSLGEDDGADVTQVSRTAAFRMLSAMQNVRGNRVGVQYECSMALQKLAGLCKGENILSGVAGPVANLRKKILKEIWDAVVKAANKMGAGVTL